MSYLKDVDERYIDKGNEDVEPLNKALYSQCIQ